MRTSDVAFLEVRDVVKTYQAGDVEVPVLRGVSLDVERGEFVALMGASGSGKTTLMNVLGCLDRPTSGQYRLDGEEVGGLPSDARAALRNRKIGFVFQNFNLLGRTTALENVTMPLEYAAPETPEPEARARAKALLERVGLGARLDHEPARLSGGQQQRVAIARALINAPPLLLADEPTGNLDSHVSDEVLAMLGELHRDGLTIVLVTHDPGVAGHARRIVRLKDGHVEDDSPAPARAEAST